MARLWEARRNTRALYSCLIFISIPGFKAIQGTTQMLYICMIGDNSENLVFMCFRMWVFIKCWLNFQDLGETF